MSKKKPIKSDGYSNVRFFIPSPLLDSQAAKPVGVRARKRAMTQLTYQTLIDNQQRQVTLEGLNEQTASNRATALRGFLHANGLHLQDVVGDEMRTRHAEAVERFMRALLADGKSARALSNTKSAFRHWKDAVVSYDAIQAVQAGKNTPFQSTLVSLFEQHPAGRVAKNAGIPRDMLYGWIKGKLPRPSNVRYVLRLEAFFGLERNSLVQLSGMRLMGQRQPSIGEEPTPIIYRTILGDLTRQIYGVKPEPGSRLRQQWTELMRYKTSAAILSGLKRTKRGQWRFSPCPLTAVTDANWWAFLDGREVASARYGWFTTSAYLGWLAMSTEAGGAGIGADEVQTMAWLAVPDFVEAYLDWRKSRTGKRNRGAIQALAFLAALVRPRFGFLRQNPSWQSTLPERYRSIDWDSLCDQQFELLEQLTASYHREIEVSRNSFEPLQHILQLKNPMEAVADMIQRMRAARPVGVPRKEAVWARDLVLIKLLASNPLRRRNLAHLTWRADNTGELYQKLDKSWWIRIPKHKFKNWYGAAQDIPYDSPIHQSAWVDIEKYLFVYRPLLMVAPTDLFFLTRKEKKLDAKHTPWVDMGATVAKLTSQYLPQCSGFGSHAFRHLAATSILKADGGDFKTAALVLNDRIGTVEKHYAFLRSGEGSTRMAELLNSAFSRM